MIRFGFHYHYGKSLEKTFFQSLACPSCGSFKINRKGKAPFYGRGFLCVECKEVFYVKLVQMNRKPQLSKLNKFLGKQQDGTTDLGEF